MDPEDLDGDRSDESIGINKQDASVVDSDDALMDEEEEIDDSAEDEAGGVLGGRSDWGTGPRPAVEIDEEAEGDYTVGEESGVLRGGGSHRRPGPRPAVHIDEHIFRGHCTRAGPDKLTASAALVMEPASCARAMHSVAFCITTSMSPLLPSSSNRKTATSMLIIPVVFPVTLFFLTSASRNLAVCWALMPS
jgi:hypothetical protein